MAFGLVFAVWAAHLAYPLQRLQAWRWSVAGHAIPAYYFLVVGPIMAAGILALAQRRPRGWAALWWLLPAICLPGIAASADPAWSARQWASWIVRGPLPGAILFATVGGSEIEPLLKRWVYPVVVFAVLLGLGEVFLRRSVLWNDLRNDVPAVSRQDDPFYRPADHKNVLTVSLPPQGTQGNRVPYAAILVAFLPLTLVWLEGSQASARPFQGAVSGAIIAVLLLAQVRAAWLATAATLGVMVALNRGTASRRLTLPVLTALAFLAAAVAVPSTRRDLLLRIDSFHLRENSISQRLSALETARILLVRGGRGVGFGMFPTAARAYYNSPLPWNGTPDNQYLRWAIESGLPSLTLLAAFFFGLIRACLRQLRRMKDAAQVQIYNALLAGWAGMAAMFLFFDGFYWGACNMTFWSLLGLLATCLKTSSDYRPALVESSKW
jgi:hypothetical protein